MEITLVQVLLLTHRTRKSLNFFELINPILLHLGRVSLLLYYFLQIGIFEHAHDLSSIVEYFELLGNQYSHNCFMVCLHEEPDSQFLIQVGDSVQG